MLFSFFLLIDPHGRCYVYEMIRCCSNFLRRGGARSQYSPDRRPTGGNLLFHGTEIRGYSQQIRGYSLECPGGLTTSMLNHILICDIGGVFWTPPPNSARQNSRPYYFLCTPPHRRRQRRAAPLHFTPLSYFTAPSAAEKALFYFLLIFLLLRRRLYSCWRALSATLPMSARGGACVIDALRRQCVLHLIFIQK